MDLKKYFTTKDSLTVPGYSGKDPFNSGNITMTGNGYMGFRGTFPWWGREEYAACTVTNTFDLADGKWKELCNVPNGLFLELSSGGKALGLNSPSCMDFSHALDFRYGVTTGSALWETAESGKLLMKWERFASYDDLHLLAQKVTLKARKDCRLTVRSGIDDDIWSLNGDHFAVRKFGAENGVFFFHGETREKRLPVYVHHRFLEAADAAVEKENRDGGAFQIRRLELKAEEAVEFLMLMSVYSANDTENPRQAGEESIALAAEAGYERLRAVHEKAWDSKWKSSEIKIAGDDMADSLLRYNMYHNFIATPSHSDSHPIGARGLSCQGYQGAAFWDQEIYNLPMFLHTSPETARNLLIYRYKTMEGAKKKARDLGYEGAFYAWISGDTGEELCPDYFFKDVLTGRKIRNHFNDWQIHISPDISYTVIRYYESTGDYDFIRDYGAEMLLEIARFLYSRIHYSPCRDRYEILRVLGPDEYHENADNNAFTNVQTKFALEKTLEIVSLLNQKERNVLDKLQKKTGVDDTMLLKMKEIAGKIYIPSEDPETGLIEQFDGYFKLEDIGPEKLAERLQDEQEYWGWPNGIAFETQVMKQADIVQLFVLHDYPEDIMRKNYLYYESRTQHRSSLSPGVHAIIASRIGEDDQAYEYFVKSCAVDTANTHPPTSGGTFIGGIHSAACGIAWQIVVKGFAGMTFDEKGMSFAPRLPKGWEEIRFPLNYRSVSLEVRMSNTKVRIINENSVSEKLRFNCFGETKALAGETEISFRI